MSEFTVELTKETPARTDEAAQIHLRLKFNGRTEEEKLSVATTPQDLTTVVTELFSRFGREARPYQLPSLQEVVKRKWYDLTTPSTRRHF